MKNKAFRRAMACLVHPISLGAILLLLLNDHLLRRRWPSWWTGKIGDFAWLSFAPFVLAVILAWLLPARLARREESVGQWAIALTGLVFGLAKTVPLFHTLTIRILEAFTGWEVGLRRDPTDLLALPALLVAYYLWKRKAVPPPRLSSLKWIALSLAVLSSVANSPIPPDYGVSCLQTSDNEIVAIAGSDFDYGSQIRFISDDGGLTWRVAPTQNKVTDCPIPLYSWLLPDPGDPQIQYKFAPNAAIRRSEDGGQTWHKEITTRLNQAQIYHYQKQHGANSRITPGPLDALIHRPTGNVVVAMGHEGVLVRTTDGEWHWVTVGTYQRDPLKQADDILNSLSGEFAFALFLAFLTLGVLSRHTGVIAPFGYVVLALAWMLWGAAYIALPPAVTYSRNSFIDLSFLLTRAMTALAFVTIPLGLKRAYDLYIFSPRALGVGIITAISGAVFFIFPYLLWGQGSIPHYTTAAIFASALALVVIVTGDRYLQRSLPAPPSPPVKAPVAETKEQPAQALHLGRNFVLQWSLANAIGFGVGSAVTFSAFMISSLIGSLDSPSPTSWTLIKVLLWAAVGALLGVMQWFILKRQGIWTGQQSRWIIASAIGLGIAMDRSGYTLFSGTPSVLLTIAKWTWLGVVVGATQWFVLRQRVNRAERWILANAIGWPIGMAVGEFLAGKALMWLLIGPAIWGIVVGSVCGAITGSFLIWLLRQPASEVKS